MSQRLGPASGRCFTDYVSSRESNDTIMSRLGIQLQNNYSYRMALAQGGSELLASLRTPVNTYVRIDKCAKCSGPSPYRIVLKK